MSYIDKMVFPQIEDGLTKITLCWHRNWIDDCNTFSAQNTSGG